MDELETTVTASDRLGFTFFIAAALHALVILGVGFSAIPKPNIPPTFEITLATHKAQEQPKDADYQAQFNQEASGTAEQVRELSTDTVAPFADTQIREVNPVPQIQARQQRQDAEQLKIQTTAEWDYETSKKDKPDKEIAEEAIEGLLQDTPLVSAEIASLRAKLDEQQQAYARRPRIRRLTSVSTIAAVDAEYLNHWRQKVEYVGNNNFPQRALEEGIFGDLRLAAIIRSNGTIVSVELLQSSGHSILDNAALQIVHLAAPFDPFPPEISKNTDQLEIIRTWRFEISGLTTN